MTHQEIRKVLFVKVIADLLEDEPLDVLIPLYNIMCDANSDEATIKENCEDNINMEFDNVYSAVMGVSGDDDYNTGSDYYYTDGSGNLNSFNYIADDNCPIDLDELAVYIIDNDLYEIDMVLD